MTSSFLRFLDYTQRRSKVGGIPLDEWLARRRDLYLTTPNTYDKHPCPVRDSNPQSQQASGRRPMSLDRAATGIGYKGIYSLKNNRPFGTKVCIFSGRISSMASLLTKRWTSWDGRENVISDVESYVNDVLSITSRLAN